jgi:hypothetical protein
MIICRLIFSKSLLGQDISPENHKPNEGNKKAITPSQKLPVNPPNLKANQTENKNPIVPSNNPGEGSSGGVHLLASGVWEK